MLIAAIYARFSSAHQKPTSIDDQVALCRRMAAGFGCTVPDDRIYADRELTGAIAQRPGYARLLAAAKAGEVQAIIVEGSDRLWRDQAEMHYALKRLRFWGIKVFSVSTGSDLTDKTGKLIASVVGWKDEVYLDDLKDKIRRGMQGRVRDGFSVGGRAYGYRSAPIYDESRKDAYGRPIVVGYRRIIDPSEAEVVRRVFHLYLGGMSAKGIAYLFNAEHVKPPRISRGRRLRGWTWQTILGVGQKAHGILRNPSYVGRMVWNRTLKLRDPDTGKRVVRVRPRDQWVSVDVPELRIISDEVWIAAQSRLQRQSISSLGNRTGRHPKYVLSGLLKCECGANYIIQKASKNRRYYGCGAHYDRGPEICDNSRLVSRDRVEQVVLDAIFHEVFSPNTLAYLSAKVNEAIAALTGPRDDARRQQQLELEKARARLENITAAIAEGIRTPSTRRMLEEAEARVAELEAVVRLPAPRRKVVYLPSVVEACLRDLRGSLETDPDAARMLLARLVGPITVKRRDGRLLAEMRGNLPALLHLEDGLETLVPEEGLEPPRV